MFYWEHIHHVTDIFRKIKITFSMLKHFFSCYDTGFYRLGE